MTRCLLLAALLALPLAATIAGPARADIDETVIVPSEAHSSVDQQTAITYARELIAAGQMDAAIKQLSEFVASHPAASDAERFLGDLYYREGKLDRAEAVYRALLAANPHDKETHNRLGVVYATQNRVDDAIAQFESALPGTDSIRDLVLMHLRKGDLPQYEAQMVGAATDHPTDADTQEELGEIYGTLHRPAEAIVYFRRALDTDSHSIAALNGVAMAYLDLHDHASAAHYLHDCLNIDPFNYACIDNLGVAEIQAGANGDALNDFKRAHRLEPERPEALVNFGYLADLEGDWKRAVTYYVQAIAVNPYVPESYINLGIDYEHNGLYPLAQAALIKGVAAAPYDGRVRYLLARAYAAQGQKALALAQLKAAQTSLDPDVAEIAKEETARLLGSASTAPQ
ncbi:MAG: tetratricopeptide repeat protein [Candidatus Eremiobacteraeota bacterium]|nr:tetratricopeptide repeat protein [Candidatus Eremiobacteraeota bacterium]MBV8498900.1 tetratricopeptide repeat protein [Candidatus Eremiobacteraeota bacterium]